MGIIPTPTQFGVNCAICWPPGETPGYLKVFFSGIMKGDNWHGGLPQPPNGYWDYIQLGVDPCIFAIPVATFFGQLWFTGADTTLGLAVVPGFPCFTYFGPLVCPRYLETNLVFPAGNWYYGGQAFICTPEEMAGWIELVMPVTGPNPRMELFPMVDRQIVIRFASTINGTNMKIKLNVDDL